MARLVRRRDEHEVAFAHAVEQGADIFIGQPHAALGNGPADQVFVIGAVEIDVAFERVAPRPAIDPVLEPVEGEDAREDEIVGARRATPRRAGRLTRREHRAGARAVSDAARGCDAILAAS